MTDHDDVDPPFGDDPGRSEEPRSEGVRIIGAQEAADAAGRPEVVRRRQRGEKRYGDRPDRPESIEDLPKVRISTSDVEAEEGEEALSSVTRPRDEPRWAEDLGFGHARALPPEEGPDRAPEESFDDGWSDGSPDWEGDPGKSADDPFSEPDDSFVLPHWTEPPTGQVPKVVIGEDVGDDDPTGAYASAPRWRDEGERDAGTDFDDLIDDAPRLGALGGSDPDDVDDYGFDSDYDRDPIEAFAPEDDDIVIDDRRSRRRASSRSVSTRSGPTRSGSDRGGDDDGDGGGSGDSGGVGGDRDLVMAVGVGIALVALGLLCFKLGAIATTALACVIVGAAAYEFFTTVDRHGYRSAGLLGMVATIGLLVGTYTSGLNAYPIVLTLTVVIGLLWFMWVQPGEGAVRNLAITILGVMWIGFLGSFATLFLGLGKVIEDAGATSNLGIGVLIAAVVVAVSHDVGAYFIGRYFGQTRLSAASPNKTLEGTAGGVLVAVVVTMVVVGAFGIAPIGGNFFRVFVFALLCSLIAPVGDLAESFVKRDLGIKDFGALLPGHGGVMDRFDALLFVLPTAYFITILFDVWSPA